MASKRVTKALRNVSEALKNLSQAPAKSQDNIALRRAMQKQNLQARMTSRAFDRLRKGSGL